MNMLCRFVVRGSTIQLPFYGSTGMIFVYANRLLPRLEFAITSQREAIPDGAEVFAVCDGALTIRHGAEANETLTPQEQTALDKLIAAAQLFEANSSSRHQHSLIHRLRSLFQV